MPLISADNFLPRVERLNEHGSGVSQIGALPTPQELAQLEVAAEQQANEPFLPPWLTQAVESGMTKLQTLRVTSKKPCCETVQPGIVKGSGARENVLIRVQGTPMNCLTLPSSNCAATTLIRHLAQSIPCCGIKDFVQLKVTATPPCCCVKDCTSCQACKQKATAAVQVFPAPTCPLAGRYESSAYPKQAFDTPANVWMPCPVQSVTRVVSATPTPLPRFESPDFEVHCEKIAHRGDTVVFEGNVLLLSKKHAQPIRINAQRVILNMKDGSYTVESGRVSTTTPISTFGVLRTSVISDPSPVGLPMPCLDQAQRPVYVTPTTPTAPSGMVIDVVHPHGIRVLPVPTSLPTPASLWQRCP
jgi:hypothetical protein